MSNFRQILVGRIDAKLSGLANMDYEGSIHAIRGAGLPSSTPGCGFVSFDAHAFRDLARSHGASDVDIISEVSHMTGADFESTLIKMSMPTIKY